MLCDVITAIYYNNNAAGWLLYVVIGTMNSGYCI